MSLSFSAVSAPLHQWLRENGLNPEDVRVWVLVPTIEAQARANAAVRREFDAMAITPDLRAGVVKNIKAHGIHFQFQAAAANATKPGLLT